jgi:hypothetical protein
MGGTVKECTIETTVQESEAPQEVAGEAPRRRSSETEADKVRRQLQIRRKTRLARHALTANRSR